MSRTLIAAMTVAIAALVGCSGDDDTSSGSATGWREDLGCTSIAEEQTDELYVRTLYTCTKADGATTDVFTFNTSSARDNWREIAEVSGAVVLHEGDTWLEVKAG